MARRIVTRFGANTKIAKSLGTTVQTVSRVLNGKQSSRLGDKIKHVAITQYGGKEVDL